MTRYESDPHRLARALARAGVILLVGIVPVLAADDPKPAAVSPDHPSTMARGLELPRVVGDYHMRAMPDDVSRARIDELTRLIERMGSVNLDAMREHSEAEARFTFYTTQRADLEKALADLTRAIQQMNRESRRLFEETFVFMVAVEQQTKDLGVS